MELLPRLAVGLLAILAFYLIAAAACTWPIVAFLAIRALARRESWDEEGYAYAGCLGGLVGVVTWLLITVSNSEGDLGFPVAFVVAVAPWIVLVPLGLGLFAGLGIEGLRRRIRGRWGGGERRPLKGEEDGPDRGSD